jgi:transcriptional pleiotropic regulator of transition state genes
MKSTGIVRKIDPLGRIVLPMELRKTLNIKEKDSLEIFVDGESIILSNAWMGNKERLERVKP